MARAKPELRPCGIVPDLRFNPSRSLPFSSEFVERTRRTQYFDSSHATIPSALNQAKVIQGSGPPSKILIGHTFCTTPQQDVGKVTIIRLLGREPGVRPVHLGVVVKTAAHCWHTLMGRTPRLRQTRLAHLPWFDVLNSSIETSCRRHRHGELRRHLGTVSQRLLTRTLRNLEYTGLIVRRVTRSKAIAIECSLTETGWALIAPDYVPLGKTIPHASECRPVFNNQGEV